MLRKARSWWSPMRVESHAFASHRSVLRVASFDGCDYEGRNRASRVVQIDLKLMNQKKVP